jgi:hypothetical protein
VIALAVAASIFIGVPLMLIALGVALNLHREPTDDLSKPTDRNKPDQGDETR